MIYFECYTKSDLDGFAAQTYLDDSGVSIETAVAYLKRFFDNVRVVEHTKSQSILNFSECFTITSEFIELYNYKEQ